MPDGTTRFSYNGQPIVNDGLKTAKSGGVISGR
jgi:hypothetical protein